MRQVEIRMVSAEVALDLVVEGLHPVIRYLQHHHLHAIKVCK